MKNYPQDTDSRSALRVEVWVTDRFVAKAALEADSSAGLKTGDMVFVEKIASALKKGNVSLAKAYNAALAELLADGTYEALANRYVGEDIRCK